MHISKNYLQNKKDKQSTRKLSARMVLSAVLVLGFIAWILVSISTAPRSFEEDTRVTIEKGTSVLAAADLLEEKSIIRSPGILASLMRLQKLDGSLVAGTYRFRDAPNIFQVARRLSQGDYGEDRIRVTLHEGLSRKEMSKILEDKLVRFEPQEFMLRTEGEEGHLFPDTYFFFPHANTLDVVKELREAFQKIETEFAEEVAKSDHTWDEIIVMASIIQREAYGSRDSYTISGILWNRIRKGIPLQVDAPFVYILGRGSAKLTRSDLRTDSPYNTYTNKGLPPGAIGNPGRLGIKSALRPKSSTYLFYLHDKNGGVHYANNFEGHKANKRSYLR